MATPDDISDTDDSAFLNEALGYFVNRTCRPSPSVECTETVSKYFSSKRQRTVPPAGNNSRKMPTVSRTRILSNETAVQSQCLSATCAESSAALTPRSQSEPVPVSALPIRFATAYSFTHFNRLQSECFDLLFNTDANVVVCAPTASGKTVLMEIAVCRIFRHPSPKPAKRVLYLAPLKALCAEKVADWSSKYASADLTCIEITGEDDAESAASTTASLLGAQIICATPEKWVSVFQRPNAQTELLRSISLVLVDECHMVGTSRGAVLELALLSTRMHCLQARIIAASATVGNIGDIAEWLSRYDPDNRESKSIPAKALVFGDEYRPVPLSKIVIGYDCRVAYYRFQRNLDYKLPGTINAHCSGQSVLVFCATRGSAQDLCRYLSQNIGQLSTPPPRIHLTSPFTNKLLNDSVQAGIGFHHAGLSAADRSRVEKLFLSQSIRILCSTSTLGIGVNLPANAVIVKGTKAVGYSDSGYTEYLSSDILQFVGRAGRPQFGASGKAIILTEHNRAGYYRTLVSGQEVLESRLIPALPRHVMLGVYNHKFAHVDDVVEWLRFSFLAIRMARNPGYYGLGNVGNSLDSRGCCKASLEIVRIEIRSLTRVGLLELEDGSISLSALGNCVTKHQVNPVTMATATARLPTSPSYRQVLEALCECGEFNELRITMGQKGMLNDMNKSPWLRFRLDGRVESVQQKMFILIQFGLERRPLPSSKHASGLANDMARALRFAYGPAMCIRDIYALLADSSGVAHATTLSREIAAQCREGTQALLQQISGVGPRYAEILWRRGTTSIPRLCGTTARDIEHVLGRNPPFGTKVLASAAALPFATIKMDLSWLDATSVVFTICVAYQSGGSGNTDVGNARGQGSFTIVAHTSDGILLKFEQFELTAKSAYYETQVGLCNPESNSSAILEVAPEKYVGCSQKLVVPITGQSLHDTADLNECDEIAELLLQDDAAFDDAC